MYELNVSNACNVSNVSNVNMALILTLPLNAILCDTQHFSKKFKLVPW